MAAHLSVHDYRHFDKSAWNKIVDASPDTWLFHRSEFIDLSELLGQKNLSFGIVENGHLVFICPTFLYTRKVLRNLLRLTVFSGGLGAAGPAFAPGLSEKKKLRIWSVATDYLTELARLHRSLCFDFIHAPLSDRAIPPKREFINPLAILGVCHGRMYGFDSCLAYPEIDAVIDLQQDEKEIFQRMSKSCRYAITKAQNNDLVFCVNPENSAESFVHIHHQTYERTGASPIDPRFFTYVNDEILPRGLGDFFFACLPEGKPVACLLAFTYKKRITYYAGGSLEEFHVLEPNYFLQWHAIQHYKKNNYLHYEIGPYFPYLPHNSKMFGIGTFKRKFGGTKMELWRGTLIFHGTKYILLFGLLGILNGYIYKTASEKRGS